MTIQGRDVSIFFTNEDGEEIEISSTDGADILLSQMIERYGDAKRRWAGEVVERCTVYGVSGLRFEIEIGEPT